MNNEVQIDAQKLLTQLAQNQANDVAAKDLQIANLQVTNQVLSEQIAQLKSQTKAPNVDSEN